MVSEANTVERVKWYTLARKFPQLIGRTPDGARIPGGPYTVTQAVGGLCILIVGYKTMPLWANFGTLGNFTVLIAVTGAAIFGLGRIPLGARNPVAISIGAIHAGTAPRRGRVRGRAVRIRRPHTVAHRIVVCTEPVLNPVADAVPTTAPATSAPVDLTKHQEPAAAPTTEPAPEPAATDLAPEPEQKPEPAAEPQHAPAYAVTVLAAVHAPRRRAVRHPTATSTTQLTGVQALLATVGSHPEGD